MCNIFNKLCAKIPQRWVFAFMCFFGLFHAYAMRACLSITMTEMVVPTEPEIIFDDTCSSLQVEFTIQNRTINSEEIYNWSEHTQGLILSSFYWGYVITHLPGGYIAEIYGGKHTFGVGIFLTAVFTLLTPIAVTWGDASSLIAIRVLMGLGEGVTYPAINVLLAQWIPLEERSRIGTLVYAGQLLGTIYANSVSGIILHYTNNWPSVFYLIGGICVIWYLFWTVLCYNKPREHPFISAKELNYLNKQLSKYTHEKPPPIPWKHVLKSKPLWATVAAMIGFNWSILTIVTDLPKYMSSVLKFSVQNNGYINSFVYLCMWIGSFITSWIADFVIGRNYISTTKVRKIGSVSALFCSAVFVIAASYAGCNLVLVIVMFTIAMTLMGAAYPSVMINTLDLSPNYSGILMALSNGISAGITGILSPYIIGVVTPNQTLSEWRLVFWILFVVSLVTNIIYLIFGRGEVQYWNNVNCENVNNKERRIKNREDPELIDCKVFTI